MITSTKSGISVERARVQTTMEEEEHEVYGGDIPDVGEMEGDVDPHHADVEMATADDDAVKELDEMKKRLKEMEEEAAALREMQAKVEKEMGAVQDPAGAAASQASREEVDTRSIFVGNVSSKKLLIEKKNLEVVLCECV
ncbi:hypothetical protein L1887_28594 [Cichorium endivia]|nr:hypothetical protein L1887_28594 [Cichorium endivia]